LVADAAVDVTTPLFFNNKIGINSLEAFAVSTSFYISAEAATKKIKPSTTFIA